MEITLDMLEKRPLSFSSLKEFIKSPIHYVNYLAKKREPTPAMILGSVVHALILQTESFSNRFAIEPEVDKRTTAGKDKINEFLATVGDKEVVSESTYRTAQEMVASFVNSPNMEYVRNCNVFEKRFDIKHGATGLPVCGYFDGQNPSDYTLEIKTVESAEKDDVIRDFYNRKYYLQGGMYNYIDGKRILYVAIEKTPPYLSKAFYADDDYLSLGKAVFNQAMSDFKYCMDMGLFDSGYEFYGGYEPVALPLPSWAKKGG